MNDVTYQLEQLEPDPFIEDAAASGGCAAGGITAIILVVIVFAIFIGVVKSSK